MASFGTVAVVAAVLVGAAAACRAESCVALVRGQNASSVDPELSAQPTDVPVWVVICRGRFQSSGPFDASASSTRAFYLVQHETGAWLGWGLLASDPP